MFASLIRRGTPLVVLLFMVVALLGVARTGAQAPLVPVMDPEFGDLRITIQPATDCSQGCYRVRSIAFIADGTVYIRGWARRNGSEQTWHGGWPGGDTSLRSGEDFIMGRGAGYWHRDGASGPHFAYAGALRSQSEVVDGMGLPDYHHRSYQIDWEWQGPGGGGSNATPTSPGTGGQGQQWTFSELSAQPNCGLTQVYGYVIDERGAPLVNQRLEATWDGQTIVTTRSGQYPGQGPGGFDFTFNTQVVGHTWQIRVTDGQGNSLSNWYGVRTDGHCDRPTSRNTVRMQLQRQTLPSPTPVSPSATPPATATAPAGPTPSSLNAALIARGDAEQRIQFNPDAALQAALFARGLVPNSGEFILTWGGVAYVGQRGELLSRPPRVFVCFAPLTNVNAVACTERP